MEIEKRPHPPTQTFGTIPQEERRLDVHRKAQRLPRESGKELCLPVSSLPLLEHLHCTNQSRHRDGLGTSASDLCPKRNKRQQNKLRNRYTAVLDRACLFLVHLFLWSVLPTVVSITLPVRGGQFEFIFINTRRNLPLVYSVQILHYGHLFTLMKHCLSAHVLNVLNPFCVSPSNCTYCVVK